MTTCIFCGGYMYSMRRGEDDIEGYACPHCKSALWLDLEVGEDYPIDEYDMEGFCCHADRYTSLEAYCGYGLWEVGEFVNSFMGKPIDLTEAWMRLEVESA